MKKSILIPLLGLLCTAAVHAQAPKPGSVAALLFEATITTENPPVDQNLPQGSKRRTFTTSSIRLINRDILEAMRTAPLLDGTITGWTLARISDANNVGNLYAIKAGKPAVAVPANLLTQPVAQGTATTGSSIIPATGPARPNLLRRTYATMTVKQGPSTAAGTQTLKFGTLKIGTTNHVIQTQTDIFNITGDSFTGQGIIAGTYRTQRPALGNLIGLFPGATVP